MNDVAPTLNTPAVHPTYVKLLCMTMRNRGEDPDIAIQAAGLGSWKELAGRDALVEQHAVDRFIQASLQMTGRPALALELGAAIQISAHGPMGYAAAASKDLRQALQSAVRYAPIRHALLRFRLRDTANGAAFEMFERLDMGESREFVCAVLFVVFLRLMESVVGHPLDTIDVDLPFPEPTWRGEIEREFRGRLRFNAPRLAFHINNDLLERPCITADLLAHEKACLECERLMAHASTASMAQRVRELLMGRDGQFPTLSAAARFFSVSSSTLIRRLKEEGTSFQDLLDELRKERALWYLTHTQLTVEDIASRLGYLDTTNFSRTFRRWFGTTPGEARRRTGESGGDR